MKSGFCDFNLVDFAYFDYAATTFMPLEVCNARQYYDRNIGVSANRGKSLLSALADIKYEEARHSIKDFFGFNDDYELLFFKNSSYAINELVYGIEWLIQPMDIILLGPYEHHSNYLPWRELGKRTGAIVFEVSVNESGEMNLSDIARYADRIKLLAFSSVSNTNGFELAVSDFKSIISPDTIVFVDDSQKCGHSKIDTNDDATCHILSSHKMYGAKDIAGAIVKRKLVRKIKPVMFGGGMVERVGFPNIWNSAPFAFECGTIDVGAAVAWQAACEYINAIGFPEIERIERDFSSKIKSLLRLKDLEIINPNSVAHILSFKHFRLHAHDIDQAFSDRGVIIRAGNLCSQNSITKFGGTAVTRISLGLSVDEHDIITLLQAIEDIL